MITLDIREYCSECKDFEPVCDKQSTIINDYDNTHAYVTNDTIVRCKYRKRCENIKRYLDQRNKNAENDTSRNVTIEALFDPDKLLEGMKDEET